MSGEVFLMGNSSVTKVAGVIRVSYPANSTLVVKGTSSGKQFAKDINTTSSAKAYIFLAPIGDTSYTLTATNTAGKTASKQVYVAKDQVQTVTLAYFTATIKVTYPAKSKCVIKNSSGTQVASNTNTGTSAKTWTATVNAKGTYTVTATATDGSGKTKSATVSITAEGQVETVTLTYGLYIFKNGSGLTSGYSIKSNSNSMISAPTVSSDTISWSGNSSSGGVAFYIDPAVALSGYTKLCVDFECSYNYGGNYGMGFGVGKDAATSTRIDWTQWTAKVTNGANPIARNTAQCDISALTDSEYIKVVGSYSAGKIYNIWLE